MSSEVEISPKYFREDCPPNLTGGEVVVSASTEIIRDSSASLGMTADPHLALRAFLSLARERSEVRVDAVSTTATLITRSICGAASRMQLVRRAA
jgi:hypothetical protein